VYWDEQIEPKATLDDIDLNAIEEFKEGAKKYNRIKFSKDEDLESILKRLKLMNEEGELTRAAVLLFGKDPTKFSISAFLKIGKFGSSDAELLTQDVVESNAFELAQKTLEVLDGKYLLRNISYEGLQRVETLEYPLKGLREIIFNAIIHRKYRTSPITIRIYSDRLEVWNIGGLPEAITVDKLKVKHSSHPVNPLMAKTFYLGGHIEAWGRGTVDTIEACKKGGFPEPAFINEPSEFTAILYKNITNPEFLNKLDLNDRQLKAIEYVKKNEFITSSVYQKEMETSYRTSIRDLNGLVTNGILMKIGDNKGAKYKLR
jgi:ATP-dependent DNA helicase RecG